MGISRGGLMADEDLQELLERNAPKLLLAMSGLAAAIANGQTDKRATATATLSDTLAQIMSGADVMGRKEIVGAQGLTIGGGRAAGQVGEGGGSGGGIQILVPGAAGDEPGSMLDAIMKRYKAWHAPTLAEDAAGNIENRVRQSFADGRDTALAVLEDVNDWTVAYADTVYRTNVASAYAAGEWQQSLTPDMIEINPAKMYAAVGDSDTRPNHDAANGLIAGVTDAIWDVFAPPMGFRCRCTAIGVDRFELEDRKLLNPDGSVIRVTPPGFENAFPDPGFGTGRPDRRVYGR